MTYGQVTAEETNNVTYSIPYGQGLLDTAGTTAGPSNNVVVNADGSVTILEDGFYLVNYGFSSSTPNVRISLMWDGLVVEGGSLIGNHTNVNNMISSAVIVNPFPGQTLSLQLFDSPAAPLVLNASGDTSPPAPPAIVSYMTVVRLD